MGTDILSSVGTSADIPIAKFSGNRGNWSILVLPTGQSKDHRHMSLGYRVELPAANSPAGAGHRILFV